LTMYPLSPASSPPLNSLFLLLKLKLFSPIYICFFILIFMLFTPFSDNPFPYLQETYNTLNQLPNPAQFASKQTPIPVSDPLPFLPTKPGDASLPWIGRWTSHICLQ
jgi:hypothetical protein